MFTLTRLRNLLSFYLSFAFPNLLITLACIYMLNVLGMEAFVMVHPFKYVTLLIMWSYINTYKKAEFFYYQNLGMSKRFLWICCIGIDLLIFWISLKYFVVYA
jgi:hypothetical protein